MNLKTLFKELIPPIFFRLKVKKDILNLQPTFETYDEAIKFSDTYENKDLVRVIVGKSLAYKKNLNFINNLNLDNISDARTVRTFISIASGVNNKSLKILDFGGSAGVHYFTAKQILNQDITLDWVVVETEELVEEIEKYDFENKELSFVSSISKLTKDDRKFDVIYANYSLCYTSDPMLYLEELLKLNFHKLFITNTALNTSNEQIVGLQTSKLSTNGIGRTIPENLKLQDREIVYPFVIPSKTKFESLLLKYGNIISVINEKKSTYKTVDGSFDNYGYIVTKKT